MKLFKLFLGLSFATNLVLALMIWWPRATATGALPSAKPAANVSAAPKKTSEEEVVAALRADPKFAEAVKSGDMKRLRAALIAAGFPAPYVRDMIVFNTGNSASADNLALLRLQAEKPFWKSSRDAEELALQKKLRERDAKGAELAKEAFDGRVPPHPLEGANQQRRYQFLPADKIEAVIQIDSDYAEMQAPTRTMSPDAREKARLLQQEKRADLVKILTPQELELYDLYVSPTALNMRQQLVLFQPTEDEFRALYKIRQPIDEKYSDYFGPIDAATMQQRSADLKNMEAQAREALGDHRFAEYTRDQDIGYRAAVEIASHFNLPAASAVEAYALQQSFVSRIAEMNQTNAGDRAALAAQSAQLLADANQQFTRLLGAAGADAYKRSAGGWLRTLERAAPK